MSTEAISTVDMTEVKVLLGRVDERVQALQRDVEAAERVADARHAENRASLTLFVPRPEIEAMHAAANGRLAALETFRALIIRCAVAVAALVIGGLIAVGKHAASLVHLP